MEDLVETEQKGTLLPHVMDPILRRVNLSNTDGCAINVTIIDTNVILFILMNY